MGVTLCVCGGGTYAISAKTAEFVFKEVANWVICPPYFVYTEEFSNDFLHRFDSQGARLGG